MSPTGIAILGAGIFAKEAHLPAIAALGATQSTLKAVYSRSIESASYFAKEAQEVLKQSQAPDVYHDSDETSNLDVLLARSDIQAVLVVLPITLQPSIILKALTAGKHVLSEKPVAPDVAGGLELIKEYEETFKPKGLVWRVAENWEVEPGYHVAGKIIASGKIGKVTSFNVRVVNHVPKDSKWYKTPWRTVPDYQGGFLLDGGVHTIAALRVILPSPITTLTAFSSLNMDHLPPHDTIHAVVKTEDGTHGIVELTWGAPVPSRSEEANNGISITGSDGWIWIKMTRSKDANGTEQNVVRITTKQVVRNEKGEDVGESETILEERVRGVEEEIRSFFAAVNGNDDGFGAPFAALKDVAWIQAGLTSNGQPVDLVKLISQ
ncbi:oxidoreductase family protein [Cristinia sonorae]|uniref:Oxidoreductase family protein n=1 Tax=Cristinia sonorae TaxID=1940300 RepID=A0A8K0UT88_9AGAR|nr:oxidoreductase family protein [Cristinia sonorae]